MKATQGEAGLSLSDADILKVYHDLYFSGLIGSTTHSERVPIARAILAADADRRRLTAEQPTDSQRLALLLDWWFGVRKFKGDVGQALCQEELLALIDSTLKETA